MEIRGYDRGRAIVVEVEFKVYDTSTQTYSYFDPTAPTITITEPCGAVKFDQKALVKDFVGKYHYVVQTAADWKTGVYLGTVESASAPYSDVTNVSVFALI